MYSIQKKRSYTLSPSVLICYIKDDISEDYDFPENALFTVKNLERPHVPQFKKREVIS